MLNVDQLLPLVMRPWQLSTNAQLSITMRQCVEIKKPLSSPIDPTIRESRIRFCKFFCCCDRLDHLFRFTLVVIYMIQKHPCWVSVWCVVLCSRSGRGIISRCVISLVVRCRDADTCIMHAGNPTTFFPIVHQRRRAHAQAQASRTACYTSQHQQQNRTDSIGFLYLFERYLMNYVRFVIIYFLKGF